MGYEEELKVVTALEAYGKCGSLDSALGVFTKMVQRDVVTWNSNFHDSNLCPEKRSSAYT